MTTEAELVKALADAKQAEYEYKPVIDAIKERVDAAKNALLDHMVESGGERIRKHGILIVKATRTTVKVRERGTVMDWLEERGLLGHYMTVDAKKLYEDHPEAPGLYVEETPYLSVKEDTK